MMVNVKVPPSEVSTLIMCEVPTVWADVVRVTWVYDPVVHTEGSVAAEQPPAVVRVGPAVHVTPLAWHRFPSK